MGWNLRNSGQVQNNSRYELLWRCGGVLQLHQAVQPLDNFILSDQNIFATILFTFSFVL